MSNVKPNALVASHGSLAMIEALFAAGTDLNALDARSRRPIDVARRSQH